MAFQPVPDTWQFKLSGGLPNGAHWEMNLYWRLGTYTQPTTAAADAFMDIIHDAYTDNNFDDQLHAAWSFDLLTITGLDAETDAQVESTSGDLNGTISGEALPNTVAGLMNWRTDSRGRSFRGRSFHPGFCELSSVGGGPTATALTAFNLWAGDVRDNINDGTNRQMVVVSRFSGMELKSFPDGTVRKVPKERDPAITTVITSSAADTWWKTQRRRGHGG